MPRYVRLSIALLLIVTVPAVTMGQQRGRKAKRVATPKFDESQTEEYFFSNVFAKLVGERPDLQAAPKTTVAAGNASSDGSDQTVKGWAAVITSAVIEDEIKAIKLGLDKTITTPGAFRGGGFQVCRREFTVAATLFGIITEYDDDVRFQKNSSGLRDALARTGSNCKVGTVQAYNEAKLRREDLQSTLSGSAFQGKEGDPDVTWDKICDRSPLMERLEISFNEKIQPATSSAAEFKKNVEMVSHEAQLIAAMSLVLMKEGMEDGDDEDYREFCNQMKQGASEIVTGAKQGNYEAARKGAGIITQACSTCHENYRG